MSHTERELEILFERSASLVFELEAFRDKAPGELERRPVGSGIFIAPCQALTAKHVVLDMHNVNPDWADQLRRDLAGYRWLPYFGSASQIIDVRDPNRSADWGLTNVWPNQTTDIAMLQLAPIEGPAVEMMNRMRPLFPTWSLLPPPVGATVVMMGQPRDGSPSESTISDTLTYLCQPCVVVENFERRIDRGMYNFPCYTVDRPVPHGMSGGPVFWEEKLCGIVSGGLFDQTVVASLWPLCLTVFENPAIGQLNREVTIESLFDSGQIKAADWSLVKGHVSFDWEDGIPVPLLRSLG